MNRFIVVLALVSFLLPALQACVPEVPTALDGSGRPLAVISAPESGAEFVVGDPVDFSGVATDEEDGTLPAEALQWVSSLDGFLGTGPALSRDDLSPGSHEIRFIAEDSDGMADTARVVIGVGQPPNLPPAALFSFACTGLACGFTDESSDPDGEVVAWSWDFGDGATSTERNPQHAYDSDGTYDVVLTVTDDGGATDDVTRQLTVAEPNDEPVASFTWTCEAVLCQFVDASSDADGAIVAWQWTFGDGESSTAQDPSHRYEDIGTFSVTLAVTDDDGAVSRTARDVTVTEIIDNQPPTAEILAPDDGSKFDEDEQVQFRGDASDPDGDALDLRWLSDRDGEFGTGPVVNTKNLRQGEHRISFIASDGALADTARITIEIDD